MNDARNKYGVEVGQVWRDNDERLQRSFKILSVDLDYYPGGRAECQLVEGLTKVGQRPVFFARLVRFNGNKRGYSLVSAAPGEGAATGRAKKKTKARS